MPSTESYKNYMVEQLTPLGSIKTRKMMGEFLLYCNGVHVGGIYDDRLLLKPNVITQDLPMEIPYPGAKPMAHVTEIDNSEWLCIFMTKYLGVYK